MSEETKTTTKEYVKPLVQSQIDLDASIIKLNNAKAGLLKVEVVLANEEILATGLERSSSLRIAEAQAELIKAQAEKVKVETVIKSSMQMVPGELVELEAPASNNLMLAAAIVAISILGLAIAIVVIGVQILTKL